MLFCTLHSTHPSEQKGADTLPSTQEASKTQHEPLLLLVVYSAPVQLRQATLRKVASNLRQDLADVPGTCCSVDVLVSVVGGVLVVCWCVLGALVFE